MPREFIPLRIATEISIGISLAIVIGIGTKLVQLPYGGSINLSALPILILAIRHGVKIGCITGGLYGVLDFILNPYVFHPIQVIVDYPVAFALLGLAGVASGDGERDIDSLKLRLRIAFGIILGNGLRLTAHFISGLVFFAEYVPEGQSAWFYSLSYNASYIVPETIIGIILVQFMLRFVHKNSPAQGMAQGQR